MALSSLWAVSVGLAGVALLIMCGLIFARLLAHRRDGALAARRRILIPLLLGDASDETVRAAVAPGSPILNDLAIELIQLVRGEERDRFVATSTRLGVTDQLRRTLARSSVRARMVAAETLEFIQRHALACVQLGYLIGATLAQGGVLGHAYRV